MNKSKLVLGTAQLGMPYGVNNKTGQPGRGKAFAILDRALDAGIMIFDTAAAYGNSEEILGAWIEKRALQEKVAIISKMRPSQDTLRPTEEIRGSLERLHLKKLDGYMLHAAPDMLSDAVVSSLKSLKNQGLTEHVGVSIYSKEEAHEAILSGLDYVQVPYNVFDRRLDVSGFFEEAKKAGITIFARSPFLQGLLLMRPEEIPLHLLHARPFVERFRAIATAHSATPLHAALLFVDAHPGIDHIVFGAETIAQLDEILSTMEESDGDTGLAEELEDAFKDVDASIVNPSTWEKP